MIIGKIREKILNKSTSHFLLPIEQAETYYGYLVSRYGDRLDPFKMLTKETHWDIRKSFTPSSDSQIRFSMNQFHFFRYFRQNITYLNVLKNLSYLRNLRKMNF